MDAVARHDEVGRRQCTRCQVGAVAWNHMMAVFGGRKKSRASIVEHSIKITTVSHEICKGRWKPQGAQRAEFEKGLVEV